MIAIPGAGRAGDGASFPARRAVEVPREAPTGGHREDFVRSRRQDFVANQGQLGLTTRFGRFDRGVAAFVGDREVRLSLPGISSYPAEAATDTAREDVGAPACGLFLCFEGSSGAPRVRAIGQRAGASNYLHGRAPARWTIDVPSFDAVRIEDLYPGVSLVVRERVGCLAYDLELRPGADLANIVLRVDGAERATLEDDGALMLITACGTVRQSPPVVWREEPDGSRTFVAARLRPLDATRWRFEMPARETERSYVIDPGLEFATYFGAGDGTGAGLAGLAVDSDGSIVLNGNAGSDTFPVTPGAFDTDFGPGGPMPETFASRLKADGSGLVYSTFIGGSGAEGAAALALDEGEAVLPGSTSSLDFPTTPGAWYGSQPSSLFGGGFVLRLNALGSALVFSTYVEGGGYYVALDSKSRPHIANAVGNTGQFSVTPDAYSSSLKGIVDVGLQILASDGTALVYGTFIGASSPVQEFFSGIAVDDADGIVLVGFIWSNSPGATSDYPLTPGAIGSSFAGNQAFVTKFHPGGAGLAFSTLLPATKSGATAVAIGPGRDIYVSGFGGPGLQTTPGALVPVAPSPSEQMQHLMASLTSDGALRYATYLPAPLKSRLAVRGVDGLGCCVLAGQTFFGPGPSFPCTADAYDKTPNNGDVLLAKLNAAGTGLVYATLLGGFGEDWAVPAALRRDGSVVVGGLTSSPDFPVTPGAFLSTWNGSTPFVAGLEVPDSVHGTEVVGVGTPGCAGAEVLMANRPANLGAADFHLATTNAPPATTGLLVIGDVASVEPSDPLGIGVAFHVDPAASSTLFAIDVSVGANGIGITPLPIPNVAAFAGALLFAQSFFVWPGGTCTPSPLGISSSNGLGIRILP